MDIEQALRHVLSENQSQDRTCTDFDHFSRKRQDLHIDVTVCAKNYMDIELQHHLGRCKTGMLPLQRIQLITKSGAFVIQ